MTGLFDRTRKNFVLIGFEKKVEARGRRAYERGKRDSKAEVVISDVLPVEGKAERKVEFLWSATR